MMTFSQSIYECLRKKYFDFSGRASRSEYWYFVAFVCLVQISFFMLFNLFPIGLTLVLFLLVPLTLLVPLMAVEVRRLHDTGRSGWWVATRVLVLPALASSSIVVSVSQSGSLGQTQQNGLLMLFFVGFLLSLICFVFCLMKGEVGPNKFGDPPLRGDPLYLSGADANVHGDGKKGLVDTEISHLELPERAEIVLKYNPEAKRQLDELKDFPREVTQGFASRIADRPNADLRELMQEVLLEALSIKDGVWSEELDRSFRFIRRFGGAAVAEFIRVFPVLHPSMTAPQVAAEVAERIIGECKRKIRIPDEYGSDRLVAFYSSGLIRLEGHPSVFDELEKVYAFLNTPQMKRFHAQIYPDAPISSGDFNFSV